MNGLIALALHKTAKSANQDVNLRSVLIHEIGDTLSTAAVILGGWAIFAGGPAWIDAALSLAIGAMILWSSYGIIRETLNILLEGTPRGMKLEDIAAEMKTVKGVEDVHDLHVWSIGSEIHALSCHVLIADIPPSESNAILRNVEQRLIDRFHIHHTTIQFEHAGCEVEHGCVMPTSSAHTHEHLGHRH
jgi:cobalt-zinc-cadmium efflux system protein